MSNMTTWYQKFLSSRPTHSYGFQYLWICASSISEAWVHHDTALVASALTDPPRDGLLHYHNGNFAPETMVSTNDSDQHASPFSSGQGVCCPTTFGTITAVG